LQRAAREAPSEIAEIAVFNYLREWPAKIAASIAAKAAEQLLERWEKEWDEMIQRGDSRETYLSTSHEIMKHHVYLSAIIARRSSSNPVAERHVIELLAHLPPDSAAGTAIRVVGHQEYRVGYESRYQQHGRTEARGREGLRPSTALEFRADATLGHQSGPGGYRPTH
jgi:hypothetical protein